MQATWYSESVQYRTGCSGVLCSVINTSGYEVKWSYVRRIAIKSEALLNWFLHHGRRTAMMPRWYKTKCDLPLTKHDPRNRSVVTSRSRMRRTNIRISIAELQHEIHRNETSLSRIQIIQYSVSQCGQWVAHHTVLQLRVSNTNFKISLTTSKLVLPRDFTWPTIIS